MNEIRHYGIAGQKHGERRYQNEDGTYTELGKERRRTGSRTYGELTRKEKRQLKKERKAEKKRESNAARRAEAVAQGDYNYAVDHINEFSNEEINELVNRYNVMNQVVTIQKKEAEEAEKRERKAWMRKKPSCGKNTAQKCALWTRRAPMFPPQPFGRT